MCTPYSVHTNLIRSVMEGWELLSSCSRDSKCTRKSQIHGGKIGLPQSLLLALSEYIQWFPLAAWTQNFILMLIFLFLILVYSRCLVGKKIRNEHASVFHYFEYIKRILWGSYLRGFWIMNIFLMVSFLIYKTGSVHCTHKRWVEEPGWDAIRIVIVTFL